MSTMTEKQRWGAKREIERAIKRSLGEYSKAGGGLVFFDLGPGAEAWKTDDRKWFLANPLRSFRIRRLFEGELPEAANDGQTHVLVRQLTPGLRDKDFLRDLTKGAGFDALLNTEEIGMALWEKLNERPTIFSLNTIVRAASLMGVPVDGVQ
jgi:hypothetical protein